MSFSLGWLASHGVLSTCLQDKLIAIATGGGYEIIRVAQYILVNFMKLSFNIAPLHSFACLYCKTLYIQCVNVCVHKFDKF